jgi:hypothetical protein
MSVREGCGGELICAVVLRAAERCCRTEAAGGVTALCSKTLSCAGGDVVVAVARRPRRVVDSLSRNNDRDATAFCLWVVV